MPGSQAFRLGTLPLDRPDAVALSTAERVLTYAQLDDRVRRLTAGLVAADLQPGDRVLALVPSGTEPLELLLACARASLVLVPLNWRLAPDEQVRVAEHANAAAVVVHEAYADRAAGLEAASPRSTFGVRVGGADHERWLADQDPDPAVRRGEPDDVVLQIYTSGTTGRPKGVLLTHRNFGAKIPRAIEGWGFGPSSVSLLAPPLFHVGGIDWALCGLLSGARTIVLRPTPAEGLLDTMRRERVTHAFLVPTMLHDLCALAAGDGPSDVELIVYGASPIPTATRDAVLDTFACTLVHVYGLTETTGSFTQDVTPPTAEGRQAPSVAGLVGRPVPGVEISIRDPDTSEAVDDGGSGEVWTRSEQNSPGYADDPDATAALLTADGWLRTGDAGYLRPDGGLVLTHRIKDIIVTGGENVVPAEVEAVLREHPAVTDAAVVGLPDPRWGEVVAAAVVARGPDPRAALEEHVATHLASYKRPRVIEPLDALPRNALGKVDQRALVERLVALREQRVSA